MRKGFAFFLLPLPLFALYMGNPSATEIPENGLFTCDDNPIGVKVGYEGTYTLDRKLKINRDDSTVKKRVQNWEYTLSQGLITLNWINRLEVYGGLGALKNTLDYRPLPLTHIELMTPAAFSWEVGARTLLIFWQNLALGFDAKLLKSSSNADSVLVNGARAPAFHPRYKYKEWQFAGGLSYSIEWFTPYIGALYSDVKARVWDLKKLNIPGYRRKKETFVDRQHFALVVGTSIAAFRFVALNLELAMIGEQRASANLVFKF